MKTHKKSISLLIVMGLMASKTYGSMAAQPKPTDLVRTIITHDQQPTKALTDLLGKLNVKHTGTLESIKAATQAPGVWLRPTAEREDAPEIHIKMREELLPLYDALGLLKANQPTQPSYNHVIVLSNMVKPFRQRLAFTYALFKQGIKFNKIHLVGSERQLSATHENEKVLLEATNPDLPFRKDWLLKTAIPTTDTPMLEFLYDQADFSTPFRAVPMVALNVVNVVKSDGSITRATTGTQVTEWVKNNGTKGSTLWISNNPYNAYQDSVVRTYAPSSLKVETAGPAADINKPNLNADCLDTVARIIYQESVRTKIKSVPLTCVTDKTNK